jgi:hypothetical protein
MGVQGKKRLWKLRICHRDISNGNMMYWRRNGHLFGILIDFDLASLAGVRSDSLNLNAPFEHLYKNGPESFFWVAVYDSVSRSSSVHGWDRLDNDTFREEKCAYIMEACIPMEDKSENSRPPRH